jgi:hypothetical protein
VGSATPSQSRSPGSGRIYIYRTTTFGGAIQPSVRLDEQRVGKAIPEGFFFVDRSPGGYQIATSTEVDRTLSLTLEQGQIRFVRLDVSMGFMVGHVYPVFVDDAVGKKKIEIISYTGTVGESDAEESRDREEGKTYARVRRHSSALCIYSRAARCLSHCGIRYPPIRLDSHQHRAKSLVVNDATHLSLGGFSMGRVRKEISIFGSYARTTSGVATWAGAAVDVDRRDL